MSPAAHPAKEQSHCKCINALYQIQMYKSKKQCLPDICKPEWHCMSCITENQSTEDQLFNDRSQNKGIND